MLIYLTVSDPKKMKKIKAWEQGQLSKDDVITGIRVFDCYMVDCASLKKDDVILEKIKKARAPGFYIFYDGKLISKADGMPKANAIFSCLKKCVSKVYKTDLGKIVRKVLEIKKEIVKIEDKKSLLQQKIARLKDDEKAKKKPLAELNTLLAKEGELNTKIDTLLDLEATKQKKKVAKK